MLLTVLTSFKGIFYILRKRSRKWCTKHLWKWKNAPPGGFMQSFLSSSSYMSLYIYESTATNVVMWCLACVNIKAHTCCALARQLVKTGDHRLWPLQPAKPKAESKATINSWLLIQPGARDPPVLSHTDTQIAVHTYVETFAHSYAPVILQISGWGYYKGEIKRKEGGRTCMGTSLAETSFQLLP